jgi:hypothetical protein
MYDIFYVSKHVGNEEDWKIIKSTYPLAQRLTNINSFNEIKSKSFTKMFWVIWDDLQLNKTFNLLEYKTTKWDDMYVHIFKNGEHYDGICLFPKSLDISQREFHHRFFTNKKEIDIVASIPKRYNVYSPESYNEYLEIKDDMFWVVWPEIKITNDAVLNTYFSHHNAYDRKENHVFKHTFNNKDVFVNGLVLFSNKKQISQREFKHRFLIEKKEHNIVASEHQLYDVVFISYKEPNADENYSKLLKICPRAKRVHGVTGIHQAHIQAAKLCNTDMFWVIDGDAIIENNFNFELVMSSYDIDCVHVWRSKNPINGLEYGNGGVKLLPRQLTVDMNINTADMTTSISKKFKAMSTVSNINSFNTDAFATWRSAFRECCKLASKTIDRQNDQETSERLDAWLKFYPDKLYSQEAMDGAYAGKEYGTLHKENLEALFKINDFEWLEEQFCGR